MRVQIFLGDKREEEGNTNFKDVERKYDNKTR